MDPLLLVLKQYGDSAYTFEELLTQDTSSPASSATTVLLLEKE